MKSEWFARPLTSEEMGFLTAVINKAKANRKPVSRIEINNQFARELFCAGLLTPERESELGFSISAHEKLEWELGRDARPIEKMSLGKKILGLLRRNKHSVK